MSYFLIANGVFLIGTMFLIKTLRKNHSDLSGFDLKGSVLTATGMFLMLLGFLDIKDYSTFLISTPTFLFWLGVCAYKTVIK